MKQNLYFFQLRKIILVALLIFPISTIIGQSKTITRLGIVNPTPSNLRSSLNLISKEYISTDSLIIVGIYHESQASSIAASNKFIKEKGYDHITIEKIEGELSIKNLFEKNSCTSQFEELFENTDALIFFGGSDIPPSTYNEETFLTTENFDAGKNWELSFLHHLIGGWQSDIDPLLTRKANYTILGICLGMQEMNVASGGSLYQDIPYQVYGKTTFEGVLQLDNADIHKNYYGKIDNENNYTSIHFHPVKVTRNSFLSFERASPNWMVASIHHQSVKDVGKDFEIVATSIDGKVVEALQHSRFKNVYGVQFHPELLSLYNEENQYVVSPQKTIVLSEDTHVFLRLFWQNFSERIK